MANWHNVLDCCHAAMKQIAFSDAEFTNKRSKRGKVGVRTGIEPLPTFMLAAAKPCYRNSRALSSEADTKRQLR